MRKDKERRKPEELKWLKDSGRRYIERNIRERKNPERIEEKGRKGETQSEVRNDRDRKGPGRIEEKEWERRNPERREERTGKGETRREVRNSRGRRNPERKWWKCIGRRNLKIKQMQENEKPGDKWEKGREWRNPERREKRPGNGERETDDK
jgi:hypothetical protein